MKEKISKKVSESKEVKREVLDVDHIIITYEDGTTKTILV